MDNENVLRNLLIMRDIVPPERMHIRVPNIAGFNTPDDVEKSVEWLRDTLHIEPEVFTYQFFSRMAEEEKKESKLEIPKFLMKTDGDGEQVS